MKPLTLRQKQSLFAALVPLLIAEMYRRRYEVTFGETWRSLQEAKRLARRGIGIKNSLHTQRLAIDLNLFKKGRWLSSTKAHEPFGIWWEKLGKKLGIPLCWGGRFKRPDGGHYALSHQGVR